MTGLSYITRPKQTQAVDKHHKTNVPESLEAPMLFISGPNDLGLLYLKNSILTYYINTSANLLTYKLSGDGLRQFTQHTNVDPV